MKTNVKKLMMVFAVTAMVACSNNNDLFDSTVIEQNAKASYAENFAKKYPNVDLNRSWDLSSKSFIYSLPTDGKARTRAGEGAINRGNWYEVENTTLTWMHDQLEEGKDNRSLGNPFKMSIPSTDFTIVPIYQGQASAMYNLHAVIDGVDYLIWEKSNNDNNLGDIQIKDGDSDQWHNLHGGGNSWETWNSLFNTDGGDKWLADGSQNIVTDVRAKTIEFKGFEVGAEMYLYLDITASGNGEWGGKYNYVNNVGAQQSSLKGNMLALNVSRPSNLPENYKAMIIGCEDADLVDSDWDLNDLVLLVYGEQIPEPVNIEYGTPVVETRTVRYLIEDLGATDDFDFNDIVVDVTETRTTTPTIVNGVIKSWSSTPYTQTAILRHLGGTLPFTLKIGNTELAEMGGQSTFQTSPNLEFEVTGWNPDTHNINVQVQQQGNQGVFNNIGFPKSGEAPMILAVNPSQNWMSERQSIPESWFEIPSAQ